MRRLESVATAGAVFLTAGALLGACTSEGHSPAPEEPTAPSQVANPHSPAPPGTVQAYSGLPYGPCRPGRYETKEGAQECLDAYSGKVAVVDFGNTPNLSAQIAEAQEGLTHASHGILNLTFNIIPASGEAKTALNSESCVDINNTPKFAASIAQEVMPQELRQASFVVALSSKAPCNTRVGGVDDQLRHRGMDVYPMIGDGTVVSTIEHEIGHAVGLGHAGKALKDGVHSTTIKPNTVTDLSALASKLTYYVYEAGPVPNPMSGVEARPNELSFSLPQLDSLQWPYRELKKPVKTYVTKLGDNKSVEVDCKTALDGQTVVIDIPPVSFKKSDNASEGPPSGTLDQLVYEPGALVLNGKCESKLGSIALYDKESATTVLLASLDVDHYPVPQGSQWKFASGNKLVTLTYKANSDVISEKPNK